MTILSAVKMEEAFKMSVNM